jgi:transcriptional regulator with XRE-family HTH domain
MIILEKTHETRKFKGLSLRDVAKYCNFSPYSQFSVSNQVKCTTW